MDDPYSYESELIIRVNKYAFIPFFDGKNNLYSNYSALFSKIFFFLFHEGIKLTYYKIKSILLQRKIISEKKIIFVYGQIKGSDNFAIAVGSQACPYSEYLSFPKKLTFEVSKTRNIKQDYNTLLEYFKKNPSKAEVLYNYSPYSGKELDIELKNILVKYRHNSNKKEVANNNCSLQEAKFNSKKISIKRARYKSKNNKYDLFLVGAGAYSYSYILPYLKKVNHHTIIDINPILSTLVGEKYNFKYRDTSSERALLRLKESKEPILIIATYHSTHFNILEEALSINSNTKILVEKPPVTDRNQLERLIALRNNSINFIEIGYNRRYAPFIEKAKSILSRFYEPITMTCIIKELNIPLSHWYYWPNQGTRITGNLCHWVDLGVHFVKKNPISISAISCSSKFPADEVSVAIKFEDGSLLSLIASDRGNPIRGVQEYIDIRCEDLTIFIDDFMKMKVQKGGRQRIYQKIIRDKGHIKMYRDFINKIDYNRKPFYPNKDLKISTELYLTITELLLSGRKYIEL
ncbi:MAG: Gfo/Idh/MocA family protein [Candidatus Helarchaeota archaeon]